MNRKFKSAFMAMAILVFSSSMGFANPQGTTKNIVNIEKNLNTVNVKDYNETDFKDSEFLSWDEFLKDMQDEFKDIEKADLEKLKAFYEDAIKLEKSQKYEEANKVWEKFDKIFFKYADQIEILTADKFLKEMEDRFGDIEKADLEKLKKLYEDAVELEKSEKYEEALKVWEKFDKIYFKYADKEIKVLSADEYLKQIQEDFEVKNIEKADLEKLKAFYEDAMKLEKSEKYEEAVKVWEKFDKVFFKYVEDFELLSVDEMLDELKKEIGDIDKADLAKMESLLKEAVKFEESEEFDKADKIWKEFDEILVKYFDEGDFDDVNWEELEDEDWDDEDFDYKK
ncbi:MAG: hypothetical protein N4A48_01195 [Tepidibacter sp.]|jgi:hypothetical protein|uniref:hypothetical protein n=1 Tax=Tepidibacter sp. TaxID=2529387 RepID=UPI0025CC744B|nr:hypothetical protein [Tepidibacter sp.]MCT4507373.1 hypothetical protein [Tepidibacter sp.]